jgi:hypothetical protein
LALWLARTHGAKMDSRRHAAARARLSRQQVRARSDPRALQWTKFPSARSLSR